MIKSIKNIKSIKKYGQILSLALIASAFSSYSHIALAEKTHKTIKTVKTIKNVKKHTNSKNTTSVSKTKKTIIKTTDDGLGAKSYNCADKKGFKIVGNTELDQNLTLIYGKNNLILSRQDTETGVNRFSNSETGYDLIALPAKIMLLDTKKGMRLADDCQIEN